MIRCIKIDIPYAAHQYIIYRRIKKMEISAIDWNTMWKEACGNSPWKGLSNKELWDKRADRFNKRIDRVNSDGEKLDKDDYISKMLSHIETSPEDTLLDIGCGPGTLAIPLAKKVKSVTGLDISSEMLKHLKENADKTGISNIKYINCSWDDAAVGKDVEPHDIVVASRSLGPLDLKESMLKLASAARKAVYFTLPVVHLPFDWEVYQAIGRNERKHPSYIYVFNTLYQMGINANLEILYSKIRVKFSSIEEAIDDLQWRTTPFTANEKGEMKKYLEKRFSEQKDPPVFKHEGYSKWALIWWKTEENNQFKNQ
jgi:predicted TPR repeat methyltransferase